jgi:anthranilate phosphoribosyltransferase
VNNVEAEQLFGQMLDGAMDDAEIADVLISLADRGETVDEVVGAVRALRARMVKVRAPESAIDVAGTGGDGQHSLNVSTAVAIIVAACEVPMAKCGNRAASSLAGTADTLEALGLDIHRATEQAEASLADIGIAFIFAQKQLPMLARIAPIRRALGRKTIFNLIGPLINLGGVRRQLVGVPHPDIIPLYKAALEQLGTERAMIVSGEEGLDELSIAGPSRIATVGFSLPSSLISPEDVGFPCYSLDAIKGGDASYNAAALTRLLMGEKGAYRDAVLLNAAAALLVADHVTTLRDGVEEATEALDRGLAKALLDCWIAYK